MSKLSLNPVLKSSIDDDVDTETPLVARYLVTPPMMVGRNIANARDFTTWRPMKNGSNNFFSPKARNPRPKPVKKLFLPSTGTENKC